MPFEVFGQGCRATQDINAERSATLEGLHMCSLRLDRVLDIPSSRRLYIILYIAGQRNHQSAQSNQTVRSMQMTAITSPTAIRSPLMTSPKTNHPTKLESLLSMPKRFLSAKPVPTSKERRKRTELRIKVVTQPVLEPALRELPRSATRLLTILYEALTQAKNCEVRSLVLFLMEEETADL